MNNVNPLENVQKILKKSCELLNLDDSLYDLLKEPERTIEINIPVKMDNGKVRIFKGYRSQHCDVMGPYKGGIRFHPSVNVDEVKALSIWMSLKCSATHLPFGGGKGGIIVDVNELSENELERLSRGYVKELYKYIGDRFDIPAPDVNTNERVMAWMLDEYIKLTGNNTLATFTGKALGFGGSYGRKEATGVGVAVMTREALKKMGINIRESQIAIQGFGNVGSNTAKHLERMGGNILSISEYDKEKGVYTIYNKNGFNVSELIDHFSKNHTLYDFEGAKHISIDQFYSLDVDVIIPCALENSITEEEAQKIRAKLIVEGANGPVNYLADRILIQKNVVVIPDILANSGGVIASYFEWVQNISGIDMTEDDVLNKVEYKMLLAYNEIIKIQNQYGVTMRLASYIYSVLRLNKILKLRSRI
ncbi:Glu/Leu/Phe/Val family dehydrogenase [Parvimonas sp. C2]|uniref:Glu/Leu/Phe/Val family dehydrogenase n=1 Tax=Parvimonas sp. C2 TaxID=3110692 RepID=UPI002B49FF12|nr:Glu/Leu/Phe/Val dehydrogenase [Parvimonas sp. C2]MEB3073448.1 Glu/Leu/Phe/Val dehydrogenase [Parvimonas sp. C2]